MTPTMLTRERVIAAALAIIDRDGADGLTMRGLGRELGADPMAAYHHVPNKDAVLDGVVEAVWAGVELRVDPTKPWQDQLADVALSIRAGLRRHPKALPVMASRPNRSQPGFGIVDRTLGILLGAGLGERDALVVVNTAAEFLLGHALAETGQELDEGGAELGPAVADEAASLPHLHRVLNAVDVTTITSDDVFEEGVAALVAGVERRLAAASTS